MPTQVKALMVCTCVCLVAVTAYSVVLGGSGWLWFAWVVLGLVTGGVVALRRV